MNKKDPRESRRRKIIPNISSAKNNTSTVKPKMKTLPVDSSSSDSAQKVGPAKTSKSQVFILTPEMLKKFGINIESIPKKSAKTQEPLKAVEPHSKVLEITDSRNALQNSNQSLSENLDPLKSSKSGLSNEIENERSKNVSEHTHEDLSDLHIDNLNFDLSNNKDRSNSTVSDSLVLSGNIKSPVNKPLLPFLEELVENHQNKNNSSEVATVINKQINSEKSLESNSKDFTKESDISNLENSVISFPIIPEINKNNILATIISELDSPDNVYLTDVQIADKSNVIISPTIDCILECNDTSDHILTKLKDSTTSNENDIEVGSADDTIHKCNDLLIDSGTVHTQNEGDAISLCDHINEEVSIDPSLENIDISLNTSLNFDCDGSEMDSSNNPNYCKVSDNLLELSELTIQNKSMLDIVPDIEIQIPERENSPKMDIVYHSVPGSKIDVISNMSTNNISDQETDNLYSEKSISQDDETATILLYESMKLAENGHSSVSTSLPDTLPVLPESNLEIELISKDPIELNENIVIENVKEMELNVDSVEEIELNVTNVHETELDVDNDEVIEENNTTIIENECSNAETTVNHEEQVNKIALLLKSFVRKHCSDSIEDTELKDETENQNILCGESVTIEINIHDVEKPGGNNSVSEKILVDSHVEENERKYETKQKKIIIVKNNNCKCGVCHEEMSMRDFTKHSFKKHNLLAWMEGEEPIDFSQQKLLIKLLNQKVKAKKKLTCEKCGAIRSSAVGFLTHVKSCQLSNQETCEEQIEQSKKRFKPNDTEINETYVTSNDTDVTLNYTDVTLTDTDITLNETCESFNDTVGTTNSPLHESNKTSNIKTNKHFSKKDIRKCAVCSKKMLRSEFSKHSLDDHNLLAWMEGDTPIDLSDSDVVKKLFKKKLDRKKKLKCATCGETRMSIVGFESHMLSCQKTELEISALMEKCPVCDRTMLPASLKVHIGTHAREDRLKNMVKEEPTVEIENLSRKRKAATKALESFKKLHTENDANDTIAKIKEFIIQKSLYTKPCSTFLNNWVKRSWKLQKDAGMPMKCNRLECDYTDDTESGIKDHFINKCHLLQNKNYKCNTCNVMHEQKDDMLDHIMNDHRDLLPSQIKSSADDDNPKNLDFIPDDISEDELEDDEVEMDDIVEDNEITSRDPNKQTKKISAATASIQMEFMKEFPDTGPNFYKKYAEIFVSKNFAEDVLFPDIACKNFLPLSNVDAEEYLPVTRESCDMAHSIYNGKNNPNNKINWKKYHLFESELINGAITMWCGGPVWSLEWVPGTRHESMLSVAAESNMNSKFSVNKIYSHKNIIQFWNVGNLSNENEKCSSPANMSFAIAHSHGVVWDMEWCPSGCDDDCKDLNVANETGLTRMGLVVVACSNGSAYVYSIPHPSCLPDCESKIYQTSPAIELIFDERIAIYSKKHISQACRVTWSKMKGHACIAVGYANGYVAVFDINTKYPWIRWKVSETDVLLPYFKLQPYTEPINGLVFVPDYGEEARTDHHGVLGVSSTMGCSMWVETFRIMKKRGRFTNITFSSPWPQIIGITEAIMNPDVDFRTYHVIGAFTARCAGYSELYMCATHYFPGGGTLDSNIWSNQLLAASYCGHVMMFPMKTPLLKSHNYHKKPRLQTLLTFSEEISLSGVPVRPELPKSNPKDFNYARSEPLKDFVPDASTFEEAKQMYGLHFIDIPSATTSKNLVEKWKPNFAPIDRWPLSKILSLKSHPSSSAYFFNAFGGRAGQVRIMCSKKFSGLDKN